MNPPVFHANPVAVPVNANPQINLNLQINQIPVVKTPVAVPVPNQGEDNDEGKDDILIDNAIPVPGTNSTVPVAVPFSSETETDGDYNGDYNSERKYDTGHAYMDLQEELDFSEDTNDNKPLFDTIQLCLCRIRTDLQTPFLEFLVESTDEIPPYHLPLYTAESTDPEEQDNTSLRNNLLRKIEILLNRSDTLETPRFLGFQTTSPPVAFYDLSDYPSSVSEKIQWTLLNQITEENGFHPYTLAFFQQNIHIRTLYHLPTQEEIPPPVLVYHSFSTPTRTDDPVFGFPFVYTEKPLYTVDIGKAKAIEPPGTEETKPPGQGTEDTEQNPVEKEETKSVGQGTEDKEQKPVVKEETKSPEEQKPVSTQSNFSFFSYVNPLSTTNRSFPFILFPPPLEKTLVILKQPYQNIPPELLKKYNDVFLKKGCIRFLKNGVDYWIVKSPVATVPYLPFQQGSYSSASASASKQTTRSTASKVSFLPEKTTSSLLTTPSKKQPVVIQNKGGPSSLHLNLENLLNPHRDTRRANRIQLLRRKPVGNP